LAGLISETGIGVNRKKAPAAAGALRSVRGSSP
jgi:hypothetical protein